MVGNIVYLYLLDLENNLAVRQEVIEDRFCKIIEENYVKGGNATERYLQYKLESLNSKEVYDTNNYLSPYKFCNLQTLEETIEKLSDILQEDRKKIMLDTIDKIKEVYLTKEEA